MRPHIVLPTVLLSLACAGAVPVADDFSTSTTQAPTDAERIAILVDRAREPEERCAAVRALGLSGGPGALDALGWAWGYAWLPCSSVEVPHAIQSICARERSDVSWCRTVVAVGTPLGPIVTHADFEPQRGEHVVTGEEPSLRVTVQRTFAQGPGTDVVPGRRARISTIGPVSRDDAEKAARYAAALAWAALSDEFEAEGHTEWARDAAERGNGELDPRVVSRPEDMPRDIQELWQARTRLSDPSTREEASKEVRAILAKRLLRIERGRPGWRVR